MVEQRSPKPSVACSTRVSPAKSKHKVLAFCFKKRGAQSLHAKHLHTNAAQLTLHFVPLFKREAPYASLPKASTKCLLLVFKNSSYILFVSVLRLKELFAIIFCKILRSGKFDRLYGYFIV